MKKYIRGIAFIMCALVLSFSVMSAHTMTASAAGTVTHANMYKVVDMALSKTGIVANNDIINAISNKTVLGVSTVIADYIQYLESTFGDSYEVSVATFDDYVATLTDSVPAIVDIIRDAIAQGYDLLKVTAQEIADLIVGADKEEGIKTGVGYKVSDKVVEYIRDRFDEYAESEADFYYLPTMSPKNINPMWFYSKEYYEWFVSFLSQTAYIFDIQLTHKTTGRVLFTSGTDNEFIAGKINFRIFPTDASLVATTSSDCLYHCSAYDANWRPLNVSYVENTVSTFATSFTDDSTFTEYIQANCSTMSMSSVYCVLGQTVLYANGNLGLCTNDGRQLKVFKDVNTMKLYTVGQQPYYLNQSNDYSTTNDNSIDFTGTYYKDNSETYSYDIVQNEIDNSTEINEETVNNIVNSTTTTIVNNYYGSASDDDGTSGGDSDNDDVHGEIIEEIAGISDLIGIITNGTVGEIVEIAETVGNGLDLVRDSMDGVTEPIEDMTNILGTTVENVKETTNTMSTDLGDISDMMFDLFSFIPAEIMQLLKLSVVASLGLCVWRAIRG